jgi:uncharacterized membrane protein YdjX (TVP38/TMEM64 family)
MNEPILPVTLYTKYSRRKHFLHYKPTHCYLFLFHSSLSYFFDIHIHIYVDVWLLFRQVILLPGAFLTFGGGFVFSCTFGLAKGLLYGTMAVFVGASAGAVWAFVVGRYLLRDQVVALTQKYTKFKCLDVALERKGLHIMLLLRLSPVVPFNVINYLMGVTSVSLGSYCVAMVGIIPAITLLLFFGASAGSITETTMKNTGVSTGQIITYCVGGALGIFAVVATSFYARKELQKETAAQTQQEFEHDQAQAQELEHQIIVMSERETPASIDDDFNPNV